MKRLQYLKTFENYKSQKLNEGLESHTNYVLEDIFNSDFNGTFNLGKSHIFHTDNGTTLKIYDLEPFDDKTAKKLGDLIYQSGIYIIPNHYTFNEDENCVTYYF